jgi:outer membrane lipoprotein
MNTWRWVFVIGLVMETALASACNRYQVIPDHLKGQIDRTVTFEQIKSSPDRYNGNLVIWGGEVLSAKRLEDRTRIEVLQLPLTEDYTPTSEKPESKGRFLAFDTGKEIVDPAILTEGTPVTIIGEVRPPQMGSVGESSYQYPVLVIRDMTVWDQQSAVARSYPYSGSYYGYGYRPYTFWSGTRVGG